ncbi:PTPA-CTERM sorting domain-containing protein [Leptolyngbya sp. 7M]|uniref:PTPA-CTERM sorting domain-containing protein n=1 Tax=Leptolyngbya sp. 7M TaxID=2812896 RepID=UPI001B8ACB27|nr:PTPA-CTERM sorting domain-containing protein [Leptolyngbya sp. 7M]QYO67616.1 PTPA-CTERM sorting domain-containing protein [Leptolyngbya sp. 7M]
MVSLAIHFGRYGLTDYEQTHLYAYDPGNYFYTYNNSGVDYYGTSFDSNYSRIYGGYDSNTSISSFDAYSYSPVRFSGATPAPTAVPTPALLPGLVGLGMAALRKRKENQGQEVAETAEV